MTLRIANAGLQTTVQDLGRPSHQRGGVPGGGAMDRSACRIANTLIGNLESAAVLEASLLPPTIAFGAPALIALAGADAEAIIDDTPIPTWHGVWVAAGATLRFGHMFRGCRTYLAVAGGIDVAPVFDSRSTYVRAGFGGYGGRALRTGDVLPVGTPSDLSRAIVASLERPGTAVAVARWSAGATLRPAYRNDVVVRLVEGMHSRLLTHESKHALFETRFRVSSSSDRMGYRLEGESLALEHAKELLSEAVAFGTVQLPPGGSPIILMADRQTTGGYPRIGEVASVDLPLVAQLKPGDHLRFRPVSLADAQAQYFAFEHELAQARAAIGFRFSRGTR